MKNIIMLSLASSFVMLTPLQGHGAENPSLDFHQFEKNYDQAGDTSPNYDRVRNAVPVGTSAADAISTLRHAGAHCQSPNAHRTTINCFYREQLSVADYVNTYATWDVDLQLDADKVATVAVDRTTEQHS